MVARSTFQKNVVGAGNTGRLSTRIPNNRVSTPPWRWMKITAVVCLSLAAYALTSIQSAWFVFEAVKQPRLQTPVQMTLNATDGNATTAAAPILLFNNTEHPEAPFPPKRTIYPPISRGFSVKPIVWKRAQSCLLDSPYVPNDVPSLLSEPWPRLEVDMDLEEHYREMLYLTEPFRQTQFSSYVGYNGPWLENSWIDEFCCNRSLSDFGGLVPLFIPWTDSWHANGNYGDHLGTIEGQAFLKALRKDVIYITIIQLADGLFLDERYWSPRNHWNILIFSAGGYGHAPLPLFLQDVTPVELTAQPPNVFVFAGNTTFPLGKMMVDVLENMSAIPPFFTFRNYQGKAWINVMRSGLLNLAPRGYERSSFRTTEIIQLGLVPVYIYDDVDWSSYKGSKAHLSEFGFVVHIDEFERFVNDTIKGLRNDANYLKINQRRERILKVRESHFTMRGVLSQIRYFLQGNPKGDIACQRFPQHPTGGIPPPSLPLLNVTNIEKELATNMETELALS